ncbi:MAG: hypothetical protein J6C38_04445 [Oscillospiraceae bacterium]|nr:hypothetical protein [Oscillospiraceae bacterium]
MIAKSIMRNLSLKINLEKRNFPEDVKKVVGDFSKYLKTEGVWACYGIPKDISSGWVCLNVGQSRYIGKEMRTNSEYSKGIFRNKVGSYKNYNGDVIFTFDRPKNKPVTIRQRVWYDIGKKYKSLFFVIISESQNKEERLAIEMEYAIKNKAIYWNKSPEQKKKPEK